VRAAGTFGIAPPPLWRTGFHTAGAGRDARALQARWMRGAAAWVRGSRFSPVDSGRASVRARDPLAIEMAMLGTEEETLERVASASGGRVLDARAWPALRGGQMRETRFRAAPLAPAWPSVLLIALLLCAVWGLRKRFQID
jgi:hypothetical protein